MIGEPTRRELKKLKEDKQKAELLGIRSFFTTVTAFLQSRLPFENKLLRFLSCLNPERRSNASLRAIEYVATKCEFKLQISQMCQMNGDCTCMTKTSRNLTKIITGIADSRQQMEIRDTLC